MSAEGGLPLGLVPLSTSGSGSKEPIEIISNIARWKKLRRAVREGARLHVMQGKETDRCLMLTPTYANVDHQEPRDVADLLKNIRQWLKRTHNVVLRYVWVAELQKRGALHYHIIMWVPSGVKVPYPDQAGWWGHGSTELKPVRCAVGYITKYASKIRSKIGEGTFFPKHFRMHGCGGLEVLKREARAHFLQPQWLRDQTQPEDHARPAKGGGWLSKITGEYWSSPWQVLGIRFVPGIGSIIKIGPKQLGVNLCV